MLKEAIAFLQQSYQELNKSSDELSLRIDEVTQDIESKGYYEHTYEELAHGAKMAWRNSNKCIGRLFWNTLNVIDARELNSQGEIVDALFYHIQSATNKGKIKPTITIFRSKNPLSKPIRIWNHQLIRYAGYETDDGIIGDPMSIPFTNECEKLGWKGEGTPFDVLPLVIETEEGVEKFTIPKELIVEVEIEHPEEERVKELGLKWYAIPAISDMSLEIGGINYTAAPFNGWYMGTEIGARNFADEKRYNMLPKLAELFDLDTSKNSYLWKDRALVELNRAVLHSYHKAGVSIVDHHTAAEQFKQFEKKEHAVGRAVTGDWSWLIPPVSPATTHIFHHDYEDQIVTPNYFHQKLPY